MQIKCCVFLPLAVVAAIMCLTLAATPIYANPGISLTPFESIKVDVTPGQTLTHRMELTLGKQDQALDMTVDVMGFGSSLDGTPQGIKAMLDTSPYSARSLISLDKSSFHLEPGGSQGIIATIIVPADVGEGGRYAIIYFHEQPPAGGGGTLHDYEIFNALVRLVTRGNFRFQTFYG